MDRIKPVSHGATHIRGRFCSGFVWWVCVLIKVRILGLATLCHFMTNLNKGDSKYTSKSVLQSDSKHNFMPFTTNLNKRDHKYTPKFTLH